MTEANANANALVLAGVGNVPANVDYGDSGDGFENTTRADFKLPWLKVLDAKSKQVETVAGAKAGLIINTVTNALFPNVLFIPAITQAWYVEWKPRNQGGGGGQGFIAAHKATDQIVVDALNKLGNKFQKGADGKILLPKSPAGNDLVETYYVHGVQVNEETGDCIPAMLAFSSTGIPVYQSWLTTARLETYLASDGKRKPKPLFAHIYRLGAAKQEKNGNSWWSFAVTFANGSAAKSLLDPASGYFQAGKSVHDAVMNGEADSKVDHAAGAAPQATTTDDEIPF